MFIFDGTIFIVFTCILVIVYGILEISDNENFKTVQAKGTAAVTVSLLLTLAYSYFIYQGAETLLTDNYVDAGSKFNTVSGIENIRAMADI